MEDDYYDGVDDGEGCSLTEMEDYYDGVDNGQGHSSTEMEDDYYDGVDDGQGCGSTEMEDDYYDGADDGQGCSSTEMEDYYESSNESFGSDEENVDTMIISSSVQVNEDEEDWHVTEDEGEHEFYTI